MRSMMKRARVSYSLIYLRERERGERVKSSKVRYYRTIPEKDGLTKKASENICKNEIAEQ
jgi:hypothetical protein